MAFGVGTVWVSVSAEETDLLLAQLDEDVTAEAAILASIIRKAREMGPPALWGATAQVNERLRPALDAAIRAVARGLETPLSSNLATLSETVSH